MRRSDSCVDPKCAVGQPTDGPSLSTLPLCQVLVAALPTDLRLALQSSSCGRALLSSPQLLSKVVPILRSQPEVVLKQLCALDSSMLLVSLRTLCNLKSSGVDHKPGHSSVECQAQTSLNLRNTNNSVKPEVPAVPASEPSQRKARELRQEILDAIGASNATKNEEAVLSFPTGSPVTCKQGHAQEQQSNNASVQNAIHHHGAGGLSPSTKARVDSKTATEADKTTSAEVKQDVLQFNQAAKPSDQAKSPQSQYAAKLMHYAESKRQPKACPQGCEKNSLQIEQQPHTSAQQAQPFNQQTSNSLVTGPQEFAANQTPTPQQANLVLQPPQSQQPEPPRVLEMLDITAQQRLGASLPGSGNRHPQTVSQLSDQASRLHCLLINSTSRRQFCNSLPLLNPADKMRLVALLHQIHAVHPYLYSELNEVWHHAMLNGGSQIPVQNQTPIAGQVAVQTDQFTLGPNNSGATRSPDNATRQLQPYHDGMRVQAPAIVPKGCPSSPAMSPGALLPPTPASLQTSHERESQKLHPQTIRIDGMQAVPQISHACDLLSATVLASSNITEFGSIQQPALHDISKSSSITNTGSDPPLPFILSSKVVGFAALPAKTQKDGSVNEQRYQRQAPDGQDSKYKVSSNADGHDTRNGPRRKTDGKACRATSLVLRPYVSESQHLGLPALASTRSEEALEGGSALADITGSKRAPVLDTSATGGHVEQSPAVTADSTQAEHTATAMQGVCDTAVRAQKDAVKQPTGKRTRQRKRGLPDVTMQPQGKKRQDRHQTQAAGSVQQESYDGQKRDISALKKQLMPGLMKACSIDHEQMESGARTADQPTGTNESMLCAPRLNEGSLLELASILTGNNSTTAPEVQSVVSSWVELAAKHTGELPTSLCDIKAQSIVRAESEHSICCDTQASRQVADFLPALGSMHVPNDQAGQDDNKPVSEESNIMSQTFLSCHSELSATYESHQALAQQVAALFHVPASVAEASTS